ncbi:MAG TPA: TIGR02300 family protein [Kiloniellales bacterium]|nr:TIGR02300 family protein [Kiloniellales bacterium]
MAKPEWGTKRVCQGCGAKFYDLNRNPIACPKCGTEFDPEALLKSRRNRSAPKPTPKEEVKPKPVPAVEDDVEVETTLGEEEEEDSVLEDASDLGEDEDVVVVSDDEED